MSHVATELDVADTPAEVETIPPEVPPEPAVVHDGRQDIPGEFDYVPMAVLAPVSLFFGVCSICALMGIPALSVPLIGAVVGAVAMWQIRRSAGGLGGLTMAKVGLGLSVAFLVSGAGLHTYAYATEVPEGYERVSFNWLAKQSQQFEYGSWKLAPEVEALDGQKVYIKGYMYPTRQQTGITDFVMVKDTGQCCFGGKPKMCDMIAVKFVNGTAVNHREQQLVGVAGTFRAGKVSQSGELTAVYTLEGTHFQ